MKYTEFKEIQKIMVENNGSVTVTKDDASDHLEVLESKGLIYISGRSVNHGITVSLTYTVDMPKYKRSKRYWA